ncbi:MAG: GTPase RsgA, partial [Lachnospiraceae bacterium]|nr:GTPase RsgA [Lachnospiraceae bacterium]
DSKGRHTTTYRQMIELVNGAILIDTPGMRELGMCGADEGIDETFSDIVELEACCKFSDCKHDTEPGCAVKAAIEAGTLSRDRYELFRRLHLESNKAAKMKAVSKQRKIINRNR